MGQIVECLWKMFSSTTTTKEKAVCLRGHRAEMSRSRQWVTPRIFSLGKVNTQNPRTSSDTQIWLEAFASRSHRGISSVQFPWLQQLWQLKNVLSSIQNTCSTVEVPDFWYATLWLTRNRRSSDPKSSSAIFPSNSICFSYVETKRFCPPPSSFFFLKLWKQGIPEGTTGSINHLNGRIMITSTCLVYSGEERKTLGSRVMARKITQSENLICDSVKHKHICAATAYPTLQIHVGEEVNRATRYWILHLRLLSVSTDRISVNQQLKCKQFEFN